MCGWNKANVFIDASSLPSCHSGHDNFPAERWITDVPLMKCLWCQPPYCQEQWGWQDGHSPFHVLGCVSIIYAFTSGFITQRVENGKTSCLQEAFLSLTETNNPSFTFFSRLMQMHRLAARPASLDLMFTFGPVGGREIRAVKQMLVEDGTTTLNDTIRQNAQSMSRIAIQELLFEAQLTFPENTSSILWLPANSGQHRQQVYLS